MDVLAELKIFQVQFQKVLQRYLTEKKRQTREMLPQSQALVGAVANFIGSPGKRLRPAFMVYGYRAAGGRENERILGASIALELLHSFALIHDDIMDRSPLRRGAPAVHEQFSREHRQKNWKGDAGHYGTSQAILAGDLALSWADDILHQSGFPQKLLEHAIERYALMKTELILGQYLDLLYANTGRQLTKPEIELIQTYKSSRYTIGHPLLLGAILAGAEEGLQKTLSRYAIPLGRAFQIHDDILGTFGSLKEVGKPTNSDIREGKQTILFYLARQRANPTEGQVLEAVLGNPRATSNEVQQVKEIILKTGALQEAREQAATLTRQARRALQGTDLEEKVREFLAAVTDYLVKRPH